MVLSLVTAPDSNAEVVSLAMAKKQCRIDESTKDDDEYLQNLAIPAAIDRAELETRRALATQTWDLKLDDLPDCDEIVLPKPPLVSVTFVKYVDTSGTLQTWATTNYDVDAPAGPRCQRGRIRLAYGISWPSPRSQANAVTVRFVCGYGTTPDVIPGQLRLALLRDIGSIYEHREDVIVDPGVTIAVEMPLRSKLIYRSFKSH